MNNKSHSKILSICIPTYNRAEILSENLENLIHKVSPYRIRIIVSDNASTDNTAEIVRNAQKKYDYLTYSCNEENFGPDRNFELALKMCDAKYAWLMGDDDTLDQNLDIIMNILGEGTCNLIVIGLYKKFNEIKKYGDKDQLLIDLAGTMTWMSGLIIRSDTIDEMNFKKYLGTMFVHTGALLEALCKEDISVCLIPEKMNVVKNIGPSCSWAKNAFEYFTRNWIQLIMMLPNGYKFESKLKAIKNVPTLPYNKKALITFRINGDFDHNQFLAQKGILKILGSRDYLIIKFISLSPRWFWNIIKRIYKYLKNILTYLRI